ncbi:MAG TPA: TldD/PmbA family protein, partial [Bacteroides sp.]|nr:TldD/PmbA family protein [Bacteroides sp.]
MTRNEKYELARWAVKHAVENGADQASVTINNNSNSRVEVREQQIDRLEKANRNSMRI